MFLKNVTVIKKNKVSGQQFNYGCAEFSSEKVCNVIGSKFEKKERKTGLSTIV